jgi:hypothetical protein
MKRLNFFLVGMAALGMAFFTSCGGDETVVGPSLQITSGVSVEAVAGGTITLVWRADAGDANLKSFTIKEGNTAIVDFNNKDWTEYDIPNASNETYIDSAIVSISEATSFTLSVTDKDGQIASKTIEVTIGATGSLKAEDTFTLGGQDNAEGSFYASFDGGVYTISTLKSGSHFGEIDLIYYVGATNKEAIFSPKAIVDNNITWESSVLIASWGTPNATKFKLVTADDYTNATYASVATLGVDATLDIANGGDTPIVGLKTDDVYAFKTAGGKYGVFKVNAVTAGATNTITLAVKVQE